MFAQGTNDDNGDLEGNDPPAAAINGKLFILAFAAFIYAYYTFKQNKEIAK